MSEKLLTGLKQSNETCWNSTFIMLKSFDESYQQIQVVSQKHNQEDRLSNIDSSVFKCLINFLHPFYDATLFFEGDRYPTIHRVYMWYVKLQITMSTCTTDSPLLMFLQKEVPWHYKKDLK